MKLNLKKWLGMVVLNLKNINDCINNSKIVITMLPATEHVKKCNAWRGRNN